MLSLRRAIAIAGLIAAGLALIALWAATLIPVIDGMPMTGRLTGVGFLLAATAMFVVALVAAVARSPRRWDRAAERELYGRPRTPERPVTGSRARTPRRR
ncbi:hypothetical protein ABCS02_22275 [Microbacterium sp. X-17]|uniref:hypothetical protein n=1 Tax=Microbacterium sp. X-17 TaxID=3144404 RepID=UPI0031F56FDE